MQFLSKLVANKFLIKQLTIREIQGVYRGSILGMGWVWLVPLLMLAVYTFVFSEIFRLKWPGTEGLGSLGYAMHIFIGMLVFQFVADLMNRSPGLMQQNQNYVKKVVFPLPVLPLVLSLSSGFSLLVMTLVLIFFASFLLGISRAMLGLIIVLPAVFIFGLGISYFFSALGVYLPDIKQFNALLTSLLMFLSPIFYPLSAVPESWQTFYLINPLALFMEAIRTLVVSQESLSLWQILSVWMWAVSSLISGYLLFRFLKKGFADVF